MNKQVYEFIGQISQIKTDKVRNKKSPRYGNNYYRLQVKIKNQQNISEILVLEDFLTNKNIFSKLENLTDYQQKYSFICNKKPGTGQVWRLVDWQELNNHGSDSTRTFNKSETKYGSN